MDLVESEDSYILAREFGDKCFSITSFFTFLMVIMTTIVNVNSNMVRKKNNYLFLKEKLKLFFLE